MMCAHHTGMRPRLLCNLLSSVSCVTGCHLCIDHVAGYIASTMAHFRARTTYSLAAGACPCFPRGKQTNLWRSCGYELDSPLSEKTDDAGTAYTDLSPSQQSLNEFLNKVDADPDWFPGKHSGTKRGLKPLLTKSKRARLVPDALVCVS